MNIPLPLPKPGDSWSRRWAASLIDDLERFFLGLISGDFAIAGLLSTSGGRRIKVKSVTAASATLELTDEFVAVDFAGAVALAMPAGPGTGRRTVIQDASGAAGVNNITISPDTGTINGAASVTINSNYGRLTLVYSGSEWLSA